ncbi:MAG: phytanoyl-CoA dioxygenase family protein [Actinomycetota bacterium]
MQLTQEQIDAYWNDGYLVLPGALRPEQLAALQADLAAWVDESRTHDAPYGETVDGRARFDIEPGHSAESPALRRVASPVEVSDAFLDVMRTAPAVDAVAQLVGPNVEFNNSKINSKQPGASTHVKFHQDFMFQPHTNEDLVAVLYFLDDVTLENGPLEVVPGSHRGPLHAHWHDDVYTGAVSTEVVEAECGETEMALGPAGTACLMHTRLLHGSVANRSDRPRTLFIAEYRAEDSKALQVNHLPSIYDGEVVRGERTANVRCSSYEMRYPEVPTGASFFSQQAKAGGDERAAGGAM